MLNLLWTHLSGDDNHYHLPLMVGCKSISSISFAIKDIIIPILDVMSNDKLKTLQFLNMQNSYFYRYIHGDMG